MPAFFDDICEPFSPSDVFADTARYYIRYWRAARRGDKPCRFILRDEVMAMITPRLAYITAASAIIYRRFSPLAMLNALTSLYKFLYFFILLYVGGSRSVIHGSIAFIIAASTYFSGKFHFGISPFTKRYKHAITCG